MENLESLAKRAKDESPEDQKKRERMEAFVAFIHMCLGIAMLALGVHYEDDDKTGEATSFLKVGGGVQLAANALKILAYLTPCKFDDKIQAVVTPLLDVAYFIIVIWGSVRVFGKIALYFVMLLWLIALT